MEQHEVEVIVRLIGEDAELAELWNNHQEYEKQLAKFEGKPYLSPAEDSELKLLKKQKLAGKTKIHAILDKHRQSKE